MKKFILQIREINRFIVTLIYYFSRTIIIRASTVRES